MICITIAQVSRNLLLADMLNAVQMGADLLEIRLDTLEKAPIFTEMLAAKRKPLLFSCRREIDGGAWTGSEEDRLMLLRQAIMSKADYVEIEYDIADQIRPFPGCQRVISYTNVNKMPSAIGDIYEDMLTLQPDVIKLTVRARTPEEAWPLVQLLARPKVPTVVVGLGRPGLMMAVLGKKIGAPWTSAALEKGSEAYPGQPTIRDLEEIYHYRSIGKPTRFVGVTGLGERAEITCGLLNSAFADLQLPHRSLPMSVGNLKLFSKVVLAVRLQGIMMEEPFFENLYEFAQLDESAKAPVQAADFVLPTTDQEWVAANAYGPALVNAIEATIRDRLGALEQPLKGRMAMLAGTGPLARMLAPILKERGAALIFAGKEKAATQRLSQLFGGRQVAWEAIYTTSHDLLVLCGEGVEPGTEEEESPPDELPIHPGYLKAGMFILDPAGVPNLSRFAREAEARGCAIVSPARILVEQVRETVQRITDSEPDVEALLAKAAEWVGAEEFED